jgi:hypothetical protein
MPTSSKSWASGKRRASLWRSAEAGSLHRMKGRNSIGKQLPGWGTGRFLNTAGILIHAIKLDVSTIVRFLRSDLERFRESFRQEPEQT